MTADEAVRGGSSASALPTCTILALDPGETVGVAIYWPAFLTDRDFKIEHHQIMRFQITTILNTVKPDVIVVEGFNARDVAKLNLAPVKVIGVIEDYLWNADREIHLAPPQKPSDAMHFWTDDKLKALDLYKRGAPHAMDALRHLLYYMSFKLKCKHWVHEAAKRST